MEGAQEVPAVEGQENLLESGHGDLSDGLAESSACRATDVMKVEAAPPRRSVGSDKGFEMSHGGGVTRPSV